jgi:hypothetical protein
MEDDAMRIAGAQSAEQSGIRGVKRPFDPNIMSCISARVFYHAGSIES